MACSQSAVNILLKLGANPRAKAFGKDTEPALNGWTPLHLAIKYHMPSICRSMLNWGDFERDSVLPRSEPSQTAFACALSFSSVVERYSIHGERHSASLNETISYLPRTWLSTTSVDGQTPLMHAIDFDDIPVLKSLLDHFPELATTPMVDPEDELRYTYPILFACQISGQRDHPGTLEAFRVISAYDEKALTRVDSRGRTSLHMAAAGSSELLLKRLLSEGASARALDYEGRSPLFAANSLHFFSILLGETKDTSVTDFGSMSLAHYAVLNDRSEILEELIRLKAPLNHNCPTVGVPLRCALMTGSLNSISVLLEAGCYDAGSGLMTYALLRFGLESGSLELNRELMAHGIRVKTNFILYHFDLLDLLSKEENKAFMRAYIHEFRIDGMELDERTVLCHYLAMRGDFSSTSLLCKLAGWSSAEAWSRTRATFLSDRTAKIPPMSSKDIGAQWLVPKARHTPIHSAARSGNADALRALLVRITLPEIGSDSGTSVLLLALKADPVDDCPRHSPRSDVVAAVLREITVNSAWLPRWAIENIARSTSWQEALSRMDFGTMTVILLLSFCLKGKNRTAGSIVPNKIDWDLLGQAIHHDEMGFVATCLWTRSFHHSDLRSHLWVTPVGIMKLYHYAGLLDFHMLRWRFHTEEDFVAPSNDQMQNYTHVGGESRNFRHEWFELELGKYYQGHRDNDEFVRPREQLQHFQSTGTLKFRALYTGEDVYLITPELPKVG